MRMCQEHWEALKLAIEERGMDHLIAKDGARAAQNLAQELEGGRTIANFDPLMGAHNAILGNALGFGGLAVMAPNDDGSERCPLCFLNLMHREHCEQPGCDFMFDGWINRAADDELELWNELRAGA
jgi:hypothetical protein